MVKLPYGGFNLANPDLDKDPWVNLETIVEYLEDEEPIPSSLARWLGEAIRHCHEDPNELMRRLGLSNRQGSPPKSGDAWLIWGERVCELEDRYGSAEKAIGMALEELEDKYSRSQLQKWRDKYRKHKSP